MEAAGIQQKTNTYEMVIERDLDMKVIYAQHVS